MPKIKTSKTRKILTGILFLLLIGPSWLALSGQTKLWQSYKDANRSSIGIAPTPAKTSKAIVQVYAAKAFNWRGLFAVHTWIAIKPKDGTHYTTYQVIGWNAYRNLPLVDVSTGAPDRRWFGSDPTIIKTLIGTFAEVAIQKIKLAVKNYPYPETYRAWPGPNSNTFVAYVLSQVPELNAAMPANALGKDYVLFNQFFSKVPNQSGYQLSLYGALGVSVSTQEGLQINLLGLTSGVSWEPWGIILPGIGLVSA